MLVLDQSNSYSFANMVVRVIDNTVISDQNTASNTPVPDFNILIPTVQDVGMTNTLELYYSGEKNKYLQLHGNPNAIQYGFGPDFIADILDKEVSNVGVYTINLRGPSATMANLVVLMKYKVEEGVPYTDADGNPYYVDVNGQLTTSPTDATPVVRDVLHVKFELAHIQDCKKWMDLYKKLNALGSDTPDDDGYMTIPFFGVMYKGASAFGNNAYFNMVGQNAEYDGNMYYALTVFDGLRTVTTSNTYSLDQDAGAKYNTSYFIEKLFNDQFTTLQWMTSEKMDSIRKLFNQYLYTIDDYIAGTQASPSKSFAQVDPFTVNEFACVVDAGSINPQTTNAFSMAEGSDGVETRDELFRMFFDGEILGDVSSVLRYKMHYIIDTGYDDETKQAIIRLINKRNRMTTATLMIGGSDTFESAIIDHMANYYTTMPNIRQLAKVQSPMKYNEYIHRTMTYPCTYFDVLALMDHFKKWTNFYQPFAGAEARWTGYLEDTMVYPTETPEFIQSLYNARVNVVMKDSEDGAYLSDQLMNTVLTSDQTEFNNAFLISAMLYDLLWLVHRNHFKFNEADEVRTFKEAVNDCINEKYAQHSASLSVEVYRLGTVGRAKSANKIEVTIDMKDINKFTDVDIILTDN